MIVLIYQSQNFVGDNKRATEQVQVKQVVVQVKVIVVGPN